MQLSKDFTLAEMTFSSTAVREELDNTPTQAQIDNLKRLCLTILQPLRNRTGSAVKVSSGFRSPLVNAACNGSLTSDHCDGRAADITVSGLTPHQVCALLIELRLPFKQVIHEFKSWCHVSIPKEGEIPKQEVLTASKVGGKTVYTLGLDKS
jgi:zinc D-Ala-D-Ala carboxypeptidase